MGELSISCLSEASDGVAARRPFVDLVVGCNFAARSIGILPLPSEILFRKFLPRAKKIQAAAAAFFLMISRQKNYLSQTVYRYSINMTAPGGGGPRGFRSSSLPSSVNA